VKILLIVFLSGLLFACFSQIQFGDTKYAKLSEIQVQNRTLKDQGQLLDIYFVFNGKPLNFYHHRTRNTILIDFYNTDLGPGPFPKMNKLPLKKSKINVLKDNLQQIEHLPGEVTQVVRIEIDVSRKVSLDYTFNDQQNLFVLSAKWSKKRWFGSSSSGRGSNFWPYVITGAVGVAVVTTIVVLASGEDEPVDDGLHKTQ
jgi:hypothetical protein